MLRKEQFRPVTEMKKHVPFAMKLDIPYRDRRLLLHVSTVCKYRMLEIIGNLVG